jgi:hypothetical protein
MSAVLPSANPLALARTRALFAIAFGSLSLAAIGCTSSDRPPSVNGSTRVNNDNEDAGNSGENIQPDATVPTVVDAARDAPDAPADAGIPMEAQSPCVSPPADAGGTSWMMCGVQCINVSSDNGNCGGCGLRCGVTGTSCQQGQCICASPQTVCGTQCVDMTKDTSNCGYCGHTCQGNPCLSGVCQASSIAMTNAKIAAITVDDTNVYWTQGLGSNAGVFGKPFSGGVSAPYGAPPPQDPRGIWVSANNLYWVDYGTGAITEALLMGGSPKYIVPPSGPGDGGSPQSAPIAVALDPSGNDIFWVDYGLGTVNQKSLHGGPTVVLASGRANPIAIAVDSTYVYWADHGLSGTDGSVNRVPIATDPDAGTAQVTALATSEPLPWGLAIDATSVYWTNRVNSTGTVKRVSKQGGTVVTIAKNLGAPMGIAVDTSDVDAGGSPSSVYWTNFDDDTVLKAPIAGGNTYTLASGQDSPSAIAVDQQNVYWAAANGNIYKVAK